MERQKEAPVTAAEVSLNRFNEISDIDSQILGLLEKRSYLLRKEGSWRKSKQKSQVDPMLEKMLREAFSRKGAELGLDPKLGRTLFTMFNQFSLAATRAKVEENAEGYNLAPRREPVQASIAGPRSFRLTRMWEAMVAGAGGRAVLAPVTFNAPNKDLAKALKQAGAPVSWDDGEIRLHGGSSPSFEGKMIFAGDDPFNFYLLLCMAMGQAGRCKFTGKPELQLLDMGGLNKILPRLGGRLVPINPNNPGLPARLECGGPMDKEVRIPAGTDPYFVAALVLAAWSYQDGLTVTHVPDNAKPLVAEAVSVLKGCAIDAELTGDTCRISHGVPEIPERPVLPLDAQLAGFLLALPAFTGGEIAVDGVWPDTDHARTVLDQLTALGVKIRQEKGRIITSAESRVRGDADITIGQAVEFQPLALALGVLLGQTTITGEASEAAKEILDRMGADYDDAENGITLRTGPRAWEGSWISPEPVWSMACALMAYAVPGIVLANHGEVTRVWPEFWNFYNTLPTGEMKQRPVKEEDDNVSKRRIRVRP